jgi:DNA-binding response OmpR family regulator
MSESKLHRILVVDDQQDLRHLVRLGLRAQAELVTSPACRSQAKTRI